MPDSPGDSSTSPLSALNLDAVDWREASTFIQFCARCYDLPGVKTLCLTLQDRYGLNVNCLLAAVWASQQQWSLSPPLWREMTGAIEELQQHAVEPIRAVRRSISARPSLDPQLKAGIKRMLLYAEIRAEQGVEAKLFQMMSERAERRPAPLRENLLAYTHTEAPELQQFIALLSESR